MVLDAAAKRYVWHNRQIGGGRDGEKTRADINTRKRPTLTRIKYDAAKEEGFLSGIGEGEVYRYRKGWLRESERGGRNMNGMMRGHRDQDPGHDVRAVRRLGPQTRRGRAHIQLG